MIRHRTGSKLTPGHTYTEKLLECDPARIADRSRDLPTIPGDVPDLVAPPRGCVFAPRCAKALEASGSVAPPDVRLEARHRARCHLASPAGGGMPTGSGNGARIGADPRARTEAAGNVGTGTGAETLGGAGGSSA